MKYFLLVFFFFSSFTLHAQDLDPYAPNYPDSLNKRRLRTVVAVEAGAYVSAMTALYFVWYQGNDFSRFHFYNDNQDWFQHDKVGHAYCAYHEGVLGYRALRWAGVSEKKAAIFGGGLGFLMQTPIEILDGLSEAWGASKGDLIANTAGSALFIGQQLAWKEQRILMKFSFTPSKFADIRPTKFGETFGTRLVQDYNGQTIWLSAAPTMFAGKDAPLRWLCLSFGYGIDGVLGNSSNPEFLYGEPAPQFTRQRQFYLSLDVDLTQIRTRHRGLRSLFVALNMLKIPAPALEFSQRVGGVKFRPFYF